MIKRTVFMIIMWFTHLFARAALVVCFIGIMLGLFGLISPEWFLAHIATFWLCAFFIAVNDTVVLVKGMIIDHERK